MATFDVIVIGAGAMGSAAAYATAKAGASTLLLEQFHFLHRKGSSHGESRITRLTYPTDTYASLTTKAHECWRELEFESGTTLLSTTGGIDLVVSGSEAHSGLVRACHRNKV
jgi:glycine/D-amino acid oxidase-like deaminating enzyme